MKNYKEEKETISTVEEAAISYGSPSRQVMFSRHGLVPEFVLDLMLQFRFSKVDIARLTNISTKTLDRNLQSGKRFVGLESDRLLELAELYTTGKSTFGTQEKFLKWLNSSLPALGDTTPKSWLDTHQGIRLICDQLGRIRHGIFA